MQNLKDRYKDAKSKNKRSGEAQNLPKYFDIFDDVLGTRSVVKMRETQPPNLGNIPKVAAARAHDYMPAPEAPTRALNSEDVNEEEK